MAIVRIAGDGVTFVLPEGLVLHVPGVEHPREHRERGHHREPPCDAGRGRRQMTTCGSRHRYSMGATKMWASRVLSLIHISEPTRPY